MKLSSELQSVITWVAIITLFYTIASATVGNIYAAIDKKADIVDVAEVSADTKNVLLSVQNMTYLIGYNTARLNLLLDANGIPAAAVTDSTLVKLIEKIK